MKKTRFSTPWIGPAGLSGLALVLVSACAPTGKGPLEVASQAMERPPQAALAVPAPGGPRILSVIERRFSDGARQKIVLETRGQTPGENVIEIAIRGGGHASRETSLQIVPITDEMATGEIAASIPGRGLAPARAFAQNAYGPFGYALGPGVGSDTCLYAWQTLGRTFKRPDATLRMRLCAPEARPGDLVGVMASMTIPGYAADPAWSAASGRFAPHAATGRAGRVVVPASVSTGSVAREDGVTDEAPPARRQEASTSGQEMPDRPAKDAFEADRVVPIGMIDPQRVPRVPRPHE